MTRNGLSHAGAPLGRSEAIDLIGLEVYEDKMRLSHSVRPKERVNRRWLVSLKTNGVSPMRLQMMINTKRVEMNAAHPRNFWARDRES